MLDEELEARIRKIQAHLLHKKKGILSFSETLRIVLRYSIAEENAKKETIILDRVYGLV